MNQLSTLARPGDMLMRLNLLDNGFQVMALEPLNGTAGASFWLGRDAKLLEGGLIVSVDHAGNAFIMPREPGLPLTWVPRKWIGSVQSPGQR